jgi:glutaredoxin
MGVAAPPPRPPVSNEVYKVEVDKAPRKGGQAPKITLIEFSDFQCPFCSRAKNTLDELLKIYKDDLQISFKQFPLPFHNNAMPAAIASVAADQQGKFWEMYDKLFANQQNLDAASLEKYAQEIGLDVAKFKAAIADPKTKAVAEADMKQANQFGVQGHAQLLRQRPRLQRRLSAGKLPDGARRGTQEGGCQAAGRHAARRALRGHHQGRTRQEGNAQGAGATQRAVAHRDLQGRGQGRAHQGRQGRAGHHRPVLRLPVPVLLARGADHRQDHGRVQGQGPGGVAKQAPALPRQGQARGHRGPGGRPAGQVLADARHPVQEPAEPGCRQPGEIRERDRPRHGQVQGRPAGQEAARGRRSRCGHGRQARRARHAGVLRQRQLPVGRAALRELQVPHRRAVEEGRGAGQEGHAQGQGVRRAHEDGQGRSEWRRCPCGSGCCA